MPYFQGGFLRGMGVMGAIEDCAKAQAEVDKRVNAIRELTKIPEDQRTDGQQYMIQQYANELPSYREKLERCKDALEEEKAKEASEVAAQEKTAGELLETPGGSSSGSPRPRPSLPAVPAPAPTDWSAFMRPVTLSPSSGTLFQTQDSPMKRLGKVIGYAALIGGVVFVGFKVYKAFSSGAAQPNPGECDDEDEDEEDEE